MKRVNEDGEEEKFCRKCKEWWPADTEFFYSNKSQPDGLYRYCIACYLEYRRKRYHTGIGKSRQQERNESIYYMRQKGTKFAVIGETYSISRQRAHAVYKRECEGLTRRNDV